MHKRAWPLLIGASLLCVAGCSDKKEEQTAAKAASGKGIVITEGAVKALGKEDTSKENSGQFYYSYNKEKKEVKEEKVRTELDAYRDIRSPYERVQITMMVQQLSPDYRLLCSACHDDYANGVIGPALLDKNATYIYNRILDFKRGKKKNVLMKQLVNRIDENRLKAIAKEIERFNRQIKEMRGKQQ